jgi:hypothetical protein
MPLLLFAAPASAKKSAMVYYGDDISWSLAGVHDYIIVQPDHIDTATHGFSLYRDQVYAYVSVGEVEKGQTEYETIVQSWSIGKNKTWHSKVLDIGSRAYGRFLLDKVIDPLVKRGFRHFFFDTLDSYMIVAKTPKARARMRQGLIWLIQQFHQRYPESKLILNRGFEVIDDVHEMVEAVVIESLFWGVSGDNLDYTKVSEEDRKWLKGEMKKLASYGLPVIAVDYLPSNEKEKIRKGMAAIEALGAIPYIGDRHLLSFGSSSRNAVKREVLLLYDDTEFDGTDDDDKVNSTAFHQLSVPLEYMGYIPVLKPVTTWKLRQSDASRYAGAVVWLTGTYTMKHPRQFTKQVESLYSSGMKLLMLESLDAGKHHEIFQLLGIKTRELQHTQRAKLIYDRSSMGFEIDPYMPSDNMLYRCKKAIPLCQVQYGKERTLLAAVTPWGGYAFDGTIMTSINKQDLWIANPFRLLRRTLRLPEIPIPDVTTENGRRLLFSHVDGDGIMNRAEWNPDLFSGEVLYEKVFSHYPVPISVSIIEGETAPYGLYPKLSPTLEKIASKIFALPNIEPATHTYTHPFYWGKIIQGNLDPKYRLKVKNYTHFSVDREIGGSLAYINRKLAPKGKRARMVFWSGDCMPLASTLSYVYRNHFLQINGGDTTINNKDPWLSQVAPLGLQRGNYYQVFTGAQNENVYTNDWLGPFWGFKRVIQTFKHTDAPRRFKPIDIYYHLYSGSKRASLKALKTVYEWAISQEVMPVYTSEYIPKVMDYYAVSIAKEGEQWRVCGTRSLRTLRISSAYHADFNASDGVIGEKRHLKSRYLHLDTDKCHTVRLKREEGRMSYLSDANGRVVNCQREQKRTKMVLHAHVPLEMRFHRTKACQIEVDPPAETTSLKGESVLYRYTTRKDANVTIECH